MEHLISFLGVGTICLVACLFLTTWRLYKKDNTYLSLASIILAGVLLRILMILDPQLHAWDERYHALVAKNMIEAPLEPKLYKNPILPYDYKNWTTNHIWLHKQPMSLWFIAGSIKLFGTHTWAVRLPSLIVSTISIYLIFWIGKVLFDEKVGLFSAFMLAINGLILELTSGRITADHVDIFYLFFVLLGVFFAVKLARFNHWVYNFLWGFVLGFAILTKWLPALIIVPVGLLIRFSGCATQVSLKKSMIDLAIMLGVATLVFLPWQLYTQYHFPLESAWEKKYNWLHIFTDIENQAEPFYYHFDNMRILYGELIYIPILWLLYRVSIKRRDFKLLALLIWVFIPFIFFSVVVTKMKAYTLISAPALFLICGLFWRMVSIYQRRFKYKIIPKLLLIGLIVLPIRYSLERIKPMEEKMIVPKWMMKINQLKKIKDDQPLIIFNTDRPVETMFHINCMAYNEVPSPALVTRLESQGYKVIVLSK